MVCVQDNAIIQHTVYIIATHEPMHITVLNMPGTPA